MSKYFIQGESVEAIADEVRELSGTTDLMGLTAIKSHVGEANSEINSQAELLAQIISALDGKAAGGSDSSYSVTFNDEAGETVAVFSVLPSVGVHAPVCDVRNWKSEAGDLIIFPYTPNESITLVPVPPALSDDLYAFYGLSIEDYPYLMIWARNSNEAKIYFAKNITNNGYGFSGDLYYGTASMSGVDISDADAVAAACRTALPSLSSLTRTTGLTGPYDGSGMYFYTNYDISVSSGTLNRID